MRGRIEGDVTRKRPTERALLLSRRFAMESLWAFAACTTYALSDGESRVRRFPAASAKLLSSAYERIAWGLEKMDSPASCRARTETSRCLWTA